MNLAELKLMKIGELVKLAREYKVDGFSSMRKQELIFALLQAQADKDPQSYKRELSLFNNWIDPVIGALLFKDIAPIHIEKIKSNMADHCPK